MTKKYIRAWASLSSFTHLYGLPSSLPVVVSLYVSYMEHQKLCHSYLSYAHLCHVLHSLLTISPCLAITSLHNCVSVSSAVICHISITKSHSFRIGAATWAWLTVFLMPKSMNMVTGNLMHSRNTSGHRQDRVVLKLAPSSPSRWIASWGLSLLALGVGSGFCKGACGDYFLFLQGYSSENRTTIVYSYCHMLIV